MQQVDTKSEVTIASLKILDIRLKTDNQAFNKTQSEWSKNSSAFDVSNCARHLWLGTGNDFESFPYESIPADHEYAYVLEGPEAYSRVVAFASGIIDNQNQIDTHNRKKFKECADYLKYHDSGKFSRFEELFEYILRDAKMAFGKGLDKVESVPTCHIALNLADQKRYNSVLVIPSLNHQGGLSQMTIDMINLLGTHKNRHAGKITLAHPDKKTLHIAQKHIESHRHKMRAETHVKPWEDLKAEIENNDRVYYCMMRNEPSEIYDELVLAWSLRERKDNLLTCTGDRAPSRIKEINLTIQGYISGRMIQDESIRRVQQNKDLIARTLVAITAKADERLAKHLSDQPHPHFTKYTAATQAATLEI